MKQLTRSTFYTNEYRAWIIDIKKRLKNFKKGDGSSGFYVIKCD